ncbi:MAG: hypothetical protein KDB00_16675 [Planctomycetales bacterium]|nr:hypothetical protein [Planctomycetales bacterium]
MNHMKTVCRGIVLSAVWISSLSIVAPVHAHMPWLASDDEGKAILWFGESPSDRTYHLPKSVASIALNVDGKGVQPTEVIESKEFVGLVSEHKIPTNSEVFGTVTYGVYHGMKLTYHVEHLPHQDSATWPTAARENADLQTVVTRASDGGVVATVLRDGKPVGGVGVKLFGEDGTEKGRAETDAVGMVTFSDSQLAPGLNGLLVSVQDDSASGTLNGMPYTNAAEYLTATFVVQAAKSSDDREYPASVIRSGRADLPEELTSFGAAIAGGKLYVYGGHTGAAHSYSVDEQSDRFWCLDLDDKSASWQPRAGGPRLQGLALVPWRDGVVRIGGFTAMNQTGADHDLVSQSSVSIYDPIADTWTDLDPMPEPRSSFDAAVLGNRVYVLGGWQLDGDSGDGRWLGSAYSLDLSDAGAKWQRLAEPPFQRRALSVAAHRGRLYAIGGMRSQGGPTVRVDVYDPVNDRWESAPNLPGEGMSGFGSSACVNHDRMYVSTMDGFVHQLSDAGTGWKTIGKIEPARFFHRLVPLGGDLLIIGGANMQIGKFTEIDLVRVGG